MREQNAIVPVEQREIPFYDDMVIAVVAKDGTVYVPVKPLCDLIGVDWHGQRQRIGRDPILSDEMSECGGVDGELYRRYGVTSYKHISVSRFDHVMSWLREWWQTLTDGSELPF